MIWIEKQWKSNWEECISCRHWKIIVLVFDLRSMGYDDDYFNLKRWNLIGVIEQGCSYDM